jgi:hypothetical protein
MASLFPQLFGGDAERSMAKPMGLGGPALLSGSAEVPPGYRLPRRYPVPPHYPQGGTVREIQPSIPGATGDDVLAGEQQITRDWLDERERRGAEGVTRSPR